MRVLVSVITGGRPALASRPTHRFLPLLAAAGFTDMEWVVRADHAADYEADDYPLNTYGVTWADRYAMSHWRHPTVNFTAGGFHGAFTGREHAMRSAEDRGYDAVLQLDDNVLRCGLLSVNRPACRAALGGGEMLRLLVQFAASTNAVMCGAQLNSVPFKKEQTIRAGYPYSVFVERCGPGRVPYYGPFEDDIMHALDYALTGGPGRTAGLVPVMRYVKDHSAKANGMRAHYNAGRGLGIAQHYPDNVTLRVGRRTSSVKDRSKGMRHFLSTKNFTPVRVTDRPQFLAAEGVLHAAVADAIARIRVSDQAKIRRRGGLQEVTT